MSTRQYDSATDLITFSRASNATYLDSDGVLKLASSNVPRIEYDADGNVLGLLVEESRTNLVPYSEDFSNAAWVTGGTVTTNATTAPDGQITADLLESGGSLVNLQTVVSLTAGDYTLSFWAKNVDATGALINVYNLTTATAIYSTSNYIPELSTTSWVRIERSFTLPADGSIRFQIVRDLNANASLYIWGAQVEAGAFPTSYIPTAGATATRSDDNASIPVTDFGFTDEAGTFVAKFDFVDPENDVNNYVAGGDASARIIYNNAGNSLWQTYDGNAAITFGSLDNTGADTFKAAVGVKTGKDAVTFLNGTFTGSSTSATDLMTNLAGGDLVLGGPSATQKLNGHIKSIKYYPRRLTDAQLQELTT